MSEMKRYDADDISLLFLIAEELVNTISKKIKQLPKPSYYGDGAVRRSSNNIAVALLIFVLLVIVLNLSKPVPQNMVAAGYIDRTAISLLLSYQ